MRRLGALALLVAIAVAGCGSDARSQSPPARERPTVFAASSLTEVFRRIDPSARYSFAGSDELAAQIEQGAPADVYAAASSEYGDELHAKGLTGTPRVFATNRLVLIVPADNPARIASVADLARDGVKLVVGAEGVPVGDYTRTVLATMGESDVLRNVVSDEDDVKGVVAKVALGEADAGFVYATDVKPAGDDVRAIALPAKAQARVEYPIAVVEGAAHPRAARAFVRRVLSRAGRHALRAAGFGVP